MSPSLGIALVHGYTGSFEDFALLLQHLSSTFPDAIITNIKLPGHGKDETPDFEIKQFENSVFETYSDHLKNCEKLVFIAHSTGGTILLSAIFRFELKPDLIILTSTPHTVDVDYISRWKLHTEGKKELPLSSVAKMVSAINSINKKTYTPKIPALILHGTDDELVPVSSASDWEKASFLYPTRSVSVPAGKHDIFRGDGGAYVIDLIMRAVSDLAKTHEQTESVNKLIKIEKEISDFLRVSPFSQNYLLNSPSGKNAISAPINLSETADEPIIVNIEVTTHCNLRCAYCARSFVKKPQKHMSVEVFKQLLTILPHAYRVTLVGLGETLLHPDIVELVEEASRSKRRIGIVTNAMNLNESLSLKLIDAGLDSIAFSIDTPDQDTADKIRAGSKIDRISENIKNFVHISKNSRQISTAVFSAISYDTVFRLKALIDLVSDLGVHVLMLTDLNFLENRNNTINKNANQEIIQAIKEAIVYSFSQKSLPILSVHALEEFGLFERYKDFLLLHPEKILDRSKTRKWCYSPWQTIPIDVDGNVTICDCQPSNIIGNIFTDPFSKIWNGVRMNNFRKELISSNPPATCLACPRF